MLATCNADGSPRATPLFYLPEGDRRIYWFSSARSVHSRNLKRDARAWVTVYANTADWKAIRGLEMRGAVEAKLAGKRAIADAYVERFRLGRSFEAVMARSQLYCFEPSWIRYIDNTREFGYKCTVER